MVFSVRPPGLYMGHRVGQLANCSVLLMPTAKMVWASRCDKYSAIFGIIAGKDYRSPLWDQALPESLEEQNGKPV